MKHITFYFDFISPYAYLAFEKMPQALLGLSYSVTYKPVLFAAMLKHYGQLGPAEIAPKRVWTYRQVQWLADTQGTRLDLPASHPFNPLALLRLACAAATGPAGSPGRHVCESVFRHVWQGGQRADDPYRLAGLVAALAPRNDPSSEFAKDLLRCNTEEAIAQSVFGVPGFVVDGRLFWGQDALPMLRGYLEEAPWFSGPGWDAATQVADGVVRAR
jgi:2-hydroxychromene-2-carboxylate isomerase